MGIVELLLLLSFFLPVFFHYPISLSNFPQWINGGSFVVLAVILSSAFSFPVMLQNDTPKWIIRLVKGKHLYRYGELEQFFIDVMYSKNEGFVSR
jgi:hypothetical protein